MSGLPAREMVDRAADELGESGAVAQGFILDLMAHAIRVTSPFVTAEVTADILGIPRSRANTLIERARRIASKMVYRNSGEGKFLSEAVPKRKTRTRKSSPLNAGTKTAKSKTSKARR